MLSNGETSKKECNELKEKVKAVLVKKLTVVELEDQAKILHEDITKHRLEPLSKDENDVNQMHQCLNLWLKMRMNNFLLKIEISMMENLRRKGLKGKYVYNRKQRRKEESIQRKKIVG
ncbi:hypothetical protein FXO37_02946, partial [Capsicum annuum]